MGQYRASNCSFVGRALAFSCTLAALAACGGDAAPNDDNDAALMGGAGASGFYNAGAPAAGVGGSVSTAGAGTTGGAGTVAAAGSGGVAGTTAGSGAAGTGGTTAVTDGGAPPMGTLTPTRCGGDASKVVMIGDSYLALSGQITFYLQMYSGQTYTRTHYVSGTQMVGGLPPSIPDQFALAKGAGDIETVIMDGGGNDVLLGDQTCHATGPADGSMCQKTIKNTAARAAQLLSDMATAGVKEVIYFFYPHVAGTNADLNPSLDYAYPLFTDACLNAPLDCKFIDTRPDYQGHPEYIGIDGIHPTAPGSEAVAKRIWEIMQANCTNGVVEK